MLRTANKELVRNVPTAPQCRGPAAAADGRVGMEEGGGGACGSLSRGTPQQLAAAIAARAPTAGEHHRG